MTKSKIIVPITLWREVHPSGLVCQSDSYYAKLAARFANLIKDRIGDDYPSTVEDFKQTGLDLAAYLEDKLSGINLWNSFIAAYMKRYGAEFPFYNVESEEMMDDEPNYSDVRFLLWRDLNRFKPGTMLNPLNPAVAALSKEIYDIMEEEFEVAPDSPELFEKIYVNTPMDDLVEARKLMQWITTRAYLTSVYYPETPFEKIHESFSAFFEDDQCSLELLFGIETYFSISTKCGPLAMIASKWLAGMFALSADDNINRYAEQLYNFETRCLQPYLIESSTRDRFDVRTLTGELLTVDTDTLTDYSIDQMNSNRVIIACLAKYGEFWHVNGASSFIDDVDDFEGHSKDYIEAKRAKMDSRDVQIKLNGGSQIGFAADWAEVSSRFNLGKAKNMCDDEMLYDRVKTGRDFVYFINRYGSMTLLPDYAKAVALSGNKAYDAGYATAHAAPMFFNENVGEELRDYLHTHNLMPDARLSGPMPDKEAKAWFYHNALMLANVFETDSAVINEP